MADEIQKIKEWLKTRKLCTMDEHMKFYCKEAESDYNLLCSIEKILDSIQKESVSNDLEEVIKEYSDNVKITDIRKIDICNTYIPESIRYGAQWQKERIMKDAKSGVCSNDNYIQMDDGTWIDLDPSMQLKPAFNIKEGEKVRVLVIKE